MQNKKKKKKIARRNIKKFGSTNVESKIRGVVSRGVSLKLPSRNDGSSNDPWRDDKGKRGFSKRDLHASLL